MDRSKVHFITLGFTTCYLIKCAGGYLLVDTSYHNYLNKFILELKKLNIDVSEIRYILLTHHHDDHAGFAAELAEISGAKLIVHEKSLIPLGYGKSEETIKPINFRIKVIFSLFKVFHKNFKYPPVILKDNDIILPDDNLEFLKQIGIDGKILYTPGHSKDSITVILDDGSAFVGDLAMNFLKFSGIKHRPIYIENIIDVFNSWDKILKHGASTIYPSHGKPFLSQRLERYLKVK